MISGTSVQPADSLLASRARELLAGGPVDSVTLVAHVCRMSGTPHAVAEHLAATMFAGRREFVRDADGRWGLAPVPPRLPASSAGRIGEPVPHVSFGSAAAASRTASDIVQTSLALTPLDCLDYVVVDVETTGSGWRRNDRITEIAAIHVRAGKVVQEFESLVNPQRSIPPVVSALTNITWSMVRNAPLFGELCDRLVPLLQGKVFVAHNAEFDWRFVTTEVARATGQRLDGERLCTVRLARQLLPELRSRRLDALAHYYGIVIEGRHRAGGDARATAKVMLRLFHELSVRDCLTFEAMRELLGRRSRRGRRRRRSAMPRGMTRDTSA